MPRAKVTLVDELLRQLGDGVDLERLMKEHKASAVRMLELMDSEYGRRLRKARQRLGRIQREMLANRFSGFAMNKLITVLQGDKPELWLRAATQVLETAEGNKGKGEKVRPRSKEEQRVFEIDQAEAGRLIHLWALGAEAERDAARKREDVNAGKTGAVEK